MLQTLKFLLPVLVPSWRFFEEIEASPRIEFALLKYSDDRECAWQEFRRRPAHVSVVDMFRRMVWNPRWNESLFLVSCAERLMINLAEHSQAHSQNEIFKRIALELERGSVDAAKTPYLQFRLVFVRREGEGFERQVTFVSSVHQWHGDEGV